MVEKKKEDRHKKYVSTLIHLHTFTVCIHHNELEHNQFLFFQIFPTVTEDTQKYFRKTTRLQCISKNLNKIRVLSLCDNGTLLELKYCV